LGFGYNSVVFGVVIEEEVFEAGVRKYEAVKYEGEGRLSEMDFPPNLFSHSSCSD